MKTSVYSHPYEELRKWLRAAREAQNLSLRDIAKITGKHHSVFGKMEQDRRRIDVVEFVGYCFVLNIDPKEGIDVIANSLKVPSQNDKRL